MKKKHIILAAVVLLLVVGASVGIVSCSAYIFVDSTAQSTMITAYRKMIVRNVTRVRSEEPALGHKCDKGGTKVECSTASQKLEKLFASWRDDMDASKYPKRYEDAHVATRAALDKLVQGNHLRGQALSAFPISGDARQQLFSQAFELLSEGASELDEALASYPPDINITTR